MGGVEAERGLTSHFGCVRYMGKEILKNVQEKMSWKV